MTSVYPNGIPDMLALRSGKAVFIEMKRPGGKTSEVQKYIHGLLNDKGFPVKIIDSESWTGLDASKEEEQQSTPMAKKKKAKKVAKTKSKKRAPKRRKLRSPRFRLPPVEDTPDM